MRMEVWMTPMSNVLVPVWLRNGVHRHGQLDTSSFTELDMMYLSIVQGLEQMGIGQDGHQGVVQAGLNREELVHVVLF